MPPGVLNIVLADRGAGASLVSHSLVDRSRSPARPPRGAASGPNAAGWTNDQTIGNPLHPSVTMGPMTSEKHLQRVLGYIDVARNSDARLVSGGARPKGQDRGWFVEPTAINPYLEYKSIYASAEQLPG